MQQITLFDLPEPQISINGKGIEGPLSNAPLVVSYGAGVDSTAMLVGLYHKGIRPDAILFSDPGNEKPETYAYIESVMNPWLEQVGFPAITTIRYQPKRFKYHPYSTLAGNCLANRTLPSISFGYKSCSLKWKGAVLDKKTRELFGDKACYRAIGYDCSPRDNKRFALAKGKDKKGDDEFIYPLQIWGWDRVKCK